MTIIETRPIAVHREVWKPVCQFADLEPEWGEAALIDGVQIAIFLLWNGTVHAMSNQDPDTGANVMSRGIVGSRGDHPTIASPLHKQVYSIRTGECFTHPELSLPVYRCRIDAGVILVQLPEPLRAPVGTAG